MSPQDLDRLRTSPGWRAHRTEIIEVDGGRVVVKGQRRVRGRAGYGLLNLLAAAAGAPLLRAVPMHGGAASQAVELRRLAALRAAGIRVPEVLHAEAEFFVMEFAAGRNLSQSLEDAPQKALGLWQQGLEFLAAAHARGQYLSQAQARNFIVTPSGLVAIDFEDDPLEVMPLAEAQARDWLIYLQSTVWLMPEAHPRLLSVWEQVALVNRAPQADLLLKTALKLGWMRHLPGKRKPWGRDIVSAQAAASFLYDWATANNNPQARSIHAGHP